MKSGLGKPNYTRRTAEAKAAQDKENRLKLAQLGPIDGKVRCSVDETCLYIGDSLPMVYKKIKSGVLESYVEDGRRWVTVRSISALSLPPDERPKLRKPVSFEPVKWTPKRGRAVSHANASASEEPRKARG